MKRVKNQSMKVVEALYFLPDWSRREFKDVEKTVRFVRNVVEKRDLSYRAQVLMRGILNVLIHSGISRANAEQAIETIFETNDNAKYKRSGEKLA